VGSATPPSTPRTKTCPWGPGLGQRSFQKIVLKSQLADLGVQRLQIHRRRCGLTSTTYPATATCTNTTSCSVYSQSSELVSTTDELGNVRIFDYDANHNPQPSLEATRIIFCSRAPALAARVY
jgi:hypothetical protein